MPRVIPAVPDEQAFAVGDVAVLAGEVQIRGGVLDPCRDALGEPTGRIDGMVALAMARGLAASVATNDDSAAFAEFLMNPIGR